MKNKILVGLCTVALLLVVLLPVVAAPFGGTPRVVAINLANAGTGSFTNVNAAIMLLQRVDVAPNASVSGTVSVATVNYIPLTNGTVAVTQTITVPINGTSASTNNLDSQSIYVLPNGIVNISGVLTNGTVILSGMQLPY